MGNLLKTCFQTFWKLAQLLIFLLIVPPLINYASLKRETPVLMEHGLPYDIGFGQRLFLRCRGNGAPTVILDAPIGMNSDVWLPLQENLKKLTTVCVYDRAGIAMSDAPLSSTMKKDVDENSGKSSELRGMDFTVERMSEDLNRLITLTSQQVKPFIFVGSDLGAIIARFYTQIYERDVNHLFLIDPLVENLLDNELWKNHWYNNVIPRLHAQQVTAAMGVNRVFLLAGLIDAPLAMNKDDDQDDFHINHRQKHLLCNAAHISASIREHFYLNETFSQMKLAWRMKSFPSNVSVTIFQRRHYDPTLPNDLNQIWEQSQEYLRLELFRNQAKHRFIDSKDKYFMFHQTHLLETPIKEAIDKWRQEQRLAR